MARQLDTTSAEISLRAARAALDDAGLSVADVDGVAARWPGPGGTVFQPGSADWAEVFGQPLRWVCDTYPQGVPGALDAAAAVAAGLCEVALVFGGQAGVMGGAAVADYTRPDNEFIACWGSLTAAQFALVAQVYRHRFAPDPERVAAIAAAIRNAGSNNPAAVMTGRGPFTAADVQASPMVAEPFRLLDLCLATEGAAAMVITTAERARDLAQPPVAILGGGAEWHRQQYVNPPRYDEVWGLGADAARRAFELAELGPQDVDVFELYDINTYEVVRQFEMLGLCAEGEGADYLWEAGIGVDGRHPLNTDGGLLSYSHIGWGGPTLKIVEAVRQLRGTAGPGQVADAGVALVSGAGSGAQYHNVMVLGRG
ncbi:MAG: thiolase family protein [Acidimicrobiia bacterium]|nr:thiolase family protein [Acidimicrobiia bacterium]MYE72732.1 thiolase family protein [Acidimicrobiia bacterium]MYJ63447.1 thiolase family protein [Acidimicrobiia bacterium]